MRVLWFTNVPLPQVAAAAGRDATGSGGHWMTELFRAVVARPGITLGVATAGFYAAASGNWNWRTALSFSGT